MNSEVFTTALVSVASQALNYLGAGVAAGALLWVVWWGIKGAIRYVSPGSDSMVDFYNARDDEAMRDWDELESRYESGELGGDRDAGWLDAYSDDVPLPEAREGGWTPKS